jgi:hypothetical protein
VPFTGVIASGGRQRSRVVEVGFGGVVEGVGFVVDWRGLCVMLVAVQIHQLKKKKIVLTK